MHRKRLIYETIRFVRLQNNLIYAKVLFLFRLQRVKRGTEGTGGDLGVARRGALQLERADLPRPRAPARPRRRARRRLAGHRLPSIGFASGTKCARRCAAAPRAQVCLETRRGTNQCALRRRAAPGDRYNYFAHSTASHQSTMLRIGSPRARREACPTKGTGAAAMIILVGR